MSKQYSDHNYEAALQDQVDSRGRELATQDDEIERLSEQWKSGQRQAFMAGFKACLKQPDIEQAWQQYRCQDPADFRAVPTKGTSECEHKWRPVEAQDWRHFEICTACKATRPLTEQGE